MNTASKQTILIVDDTAENIDVLDGILREEYRVQAARNGELALAIAGAGRAPDLILLDVVMPGISGYEVCRQLKTSDKTCDIPVVFISALDSVFDKVQGFKAGGVDFVTKPFQAEEVMARVRVHLTVHRLQAELELRNEQLREALAREQLKLAERTQAGLRAGNLAWWETELPSGHIVFDDYRAEMLGYSPQQFETYADFTELLHPDDYERTVQALQDHIAGRTERYEVEYRMQTRDGTYTWLRDIGAMAEQGSPTDSLRVIGVVEDITKRKRADEALLRSNERLRTIHALDGAILAADKREHIADVALSYVRQLVPYRGAGILTIDSDGGQATLLAVQADVELDLRIGMSFAWRDVTDLQALARGQIQVIDDTVLGSLPPLLRQGLQAVGAHACVVVPLLAESELLGAFIVAAESELPPEHTDIVREVADQLAVAIQQARLRAQIQQHNQALEQEVTARTADLARRNVQIQVAAQVARDASAGRDLDELLSKAVELARERFGFYHTGIFLVDPQNEYALLRAAASEGGRDMLAAGHKLKVGEEGIVGFVTGSGQPRVAQDVDADGRHHASPFLPRTRSEMALPLRVGDRVIGALDVQSTEVSAFGEDDVSILQVMADQLAVAIERHRLFAQKQATLEERLQMVVSNLPVILSVLDREGVYTLAEGSGLTALGLESDDVVGKPVDEIFSDQQDLQDCVRRALTGETLTTTITLGDRVFESWYGPLSDGGGEASGVTGVCIDVTEHHFLEAQVQRQQRLAAVGQLAGGIAHDFNNLLGTIMMYAGLIQRERRLPAEVGAMSQIIVDESQRASKLVRQILDFSRQSAMAAEPVDLHTGLQETIDILQKTLPARISLSLDVGPGDFVVHADPTRIQQVLMNLVLNARDAMPQGGELRVGLFRVDGRYAEPSAQQTSEGTTPPLGGLEGEWVRLSVADNGIGMSDAIRSRIFEPFFTTKGANGTGLGLAQVYGIVKQHGGEIDVETEVGHGTTFYIDLPAYHLGAEPAAKATTTLSFSPSGHGETLLLVEDQELVRGAERIALESLGYRVLAAANGHEALSLFEGADGGNKVDLVITDLTMPDMGGQELLRRLRAVKPSVNAIALTGHALTDELTALRAEGFARVVQKPLDLDALASIVQQVMHSAPRPGE